MNIHKKLTKSEISLFREMVINEYKKKHVKKENHTWNRVLKKLKTTLPINVAVGLGASIVYIYFNGIRTYFALIMAGLIWGTIVSLLISVLVKR